MRLKTNQALKNLVASFEANQISGHPHFLQDAEFDELIDYYQCISGILNPLTRLCADNDSEDIE